MRRPLVVGIGEVLWDVLPGGRELGGAPANFAYHAGALGGRGAVVSRVGDDALGREIVERLDALGVDRSCVGVDAAHPTGTVDVRLDERGVPEYEIHADVAWDHMQVTPELLGLAGRADCVCFGTLGQRSAASREAIGAFLRATLPDCLRVFDINLRQHYFTRELVIEMLGAAAVLKLNDQELPVVGRMLGVGEEESAAVGGMRSRYPLRLVALTRGEKGSTLFAADGSVYHQAAVEVRVADTVGAGDAFTAALALGMLAGMPLAEVGARAARVAAYVCSQSGATPVVPADMRVISAS